MSSSTKKLEVKFLSPQEAAEIEERQIESLIASIKDLGHPIRDFLPPIPSWWIEDDE